MYKVKIKKLPNLPQARRGGSYLNYYQMAPSFTSGSLSNPDLDYSQKLGPVDRDVANVEVEKNEKILMPGGDALGGMLTMYTAGGKRHAEGGTPLNLPEGAFVFSDFHGKDFRLGGNTKTKVMDQGILAYFGLPDRKGGYTFADIAAKYDINKDVANLMDPTEVKDKMTMDTLMYNIKNKTKKLGALAIAQESKKGEGAPKMAMPFIASMNMDPKDFDIPKISVDEMPFYQNIMKGAQQMDQQKAMMQQQQEAQASGMGMEDLAQGAPQGQMQAPEQGGMEEQYAQDMGQYMQRMGGSSFPNPYYPGRIPEEMPQAMLGYQVFKEGGGLSRFIRRQEGGPAMMPPEAMAQQAPPQGGGGGGQMEQIAAQVQQALQQGAQPEEVAAALLEKGIPPQAIAQIFVSIGMPQEEVMAMISQVTQQMQQGNPEQMEPSAGQMPDNEQAEMMAAQQAPAEASDMEAMAQYGMQIFAKGGSTGKLDRFISYAKKGLDEFDPESIVNRSYNRRRGVYIYTDANGNKYETTQPDLAVAGMPERSNTGSGGSNSVPPTQTTPTYDIPKDAVVVERQKDESAEDWAKRKQEAYDKAVDKGRVYIKSEDKYYRVGNRKKGYGEYKGPAEELKKVFNDNKDLAAMYQKLEETFKDPKIKAEYVKYVRAAAKKDDNWGSDAKARYKDKVINGTITDDQLVQAFLDHNKRNIAFAAHGKKVANTSNFDSELKYTNADIKKWSEEIGLGLNKDNIPIEQLAYLGYRDFINDRDKITDPDLKSKLAGFNVSQFGKNDEMTANGKGQVSKADWVYTNTTAGQVAGVDPGTELYDEELKAKKESEIVPPGEIGAIAKRPPAKPWLQNIIGTGMALTQDVNRYMPIKTTVPYIGQVDPQFISPVYQSQVATSMGRGMMEGMAPYLGNQVASSRQSQLYGEIADKAAQAAAAVEQANAGEATKTNATNLGVRLQGAQAQAAADSEYNTNVIGSKAIFDKNLQLKNVNIYANTVATLDNMARTDAANYVFGDEFNINGMNPFNPIQQIRGKSPNGQVSGDPGGSLMAAYQAALKNPDFAGMDKEDIKDLVIAEYNKSAYANAASSRKKTLANSIMGAYMSPVAANNPMMSSLSAYTQGMNPYTNDANDNGI